MLQHISSNTHRPIMTLEEFIASSRARECSNVRVRKDERTLLREYEEYLKAHKHQ